MIGAFLPIWDGPLNAVELDRKVSVSPAHRCAVAGTGSVAEVGALTLDGMSDARHLSCIVPASEGFVSFG